MSHLEENARLSHELQEAIDERDGYKAQRDEMKRQLTLSLEEVARLRAECQRLHELAEERKKTA